MYRVAVISDLHSNFLDTRAFDLFLQIYKKNPFDLLVTNGDLFDFPQISDHAKKIETMRPKIIREYSLDKELDFVEFNILKPIHKAKPKTPHLIRTGNHEWRWMRPSATNARAISEILEISRRRKTLKIEEMIPFEKYNCQLDIKDVYVLKKQFVFTHGNKLGGNRCEKYLQEYLMSGTSGHSHQAEKRNKVIYGKEDIEWMESMCLRTITDVEYMGQGQLPNWSQGFLEVVFEPRRSSPRMTQHKFGKDYTYIYNGVPYSA